MADTIKRRDISEITGLSLRLRGPRGDARHMDADSIEYQAWRDGHLLLCRIDNGEIVATIMRDDLFDRDGNRFNSDC